jgi:tetratricopeptide (TPR) repeat protein
MCLFLDSWRNEAKEQGRFLVVIRHWSGCVESLLKRHSRNIAFGNSPVSAPNADINFWRQPELAAKMWLAYNRRILSFIETNRAHCYIFTQRSLAKDFNLIEAVNSRFGLALDAAAPSSFDPSLISDAACLSVKESLSASWRHKLDDLWRDLLGHADKVSDDEAPHYKDKALPDEQLVDKIRSAGRRLAGAEQAAPLEFSHFIDRLATLSSEEDICAALRKAHSFERLSPADVRALCRWVDTHYRFSQPVVFAVADWCKTFDYPEIAIQYYQWGCCLKDSPPSIRVRLAGCYEKAGDPAAAAFFYQQALDLNPKNPNFNLACGRFVQRTENNGAARPYFDKAYEVGSHLVHIVIAYCVFLEQCGLQEQAYTVALRHVDSPGNTNLMALTRRCGYFLGKEPLPAIPFSSKLDFSECYRALASVLHWISNAEAEKDLIARVAGYWPMSGSTS